MVCCFGLYPLLIIPKNKTVGVVIKKNNMGSNTGDTHDKVFSIIFFFTDEIEISLDEFQCEGPVKYSIGGGNQSGYFCADFGMQSHTPYSIPDRIHRRH